MSKTECHNCGSFFVQLSNHWRQSSCDYPEITDKQREIIVGLLMGDGTLQRNKGNALIECRMSSPNYLKYIDEEFETLSTGVTLFETAKESAERNKGKGRTDFREPNEKNYSNLYDWRTRAIPELNSYRDWYCPDKVWPSDIKLTPTTIKHWYVGDGCYHTSGTSDYIEITLTKEIENKDKIENYFLNSVGFKPTNYTPKGIQFNVERTHKLFDYMGEPLPDFEYKWPDQNS